MDPAPLSLSPTRRLSSPLLYFFSFAEAASSPRLSISESESKNTRLFDAATVAAISLAASIFRSVRNAGLPCTLSPISLAEAA